MDKVPVILRTTLVFLLHENRILLGMKKRGFGLGKWNGFGGKIMKNETVREAACRELKEECNIDASQQDLEDVGLLQFEFAGENLFIEVNVFKTEKFHGKEAETEEMRPQWFSLSEIPYDQMWLDDKIWFPYMFKSICFLGIFVFKGHSEILNHQIEECHVNKLEEMKYPMTE